MTGQKQLEYSVAGRRVDAHGSIARCKGAEIVLDTDLAGRADAFNPAELLLAALAACMLKSIERVAPLIRFQYHGVQVHLHGIRQDAPPKMLCIEYEITIETEEVEHRLKLLHDNVRKYGTVFNTVAPGTALEGTLRRAESAIAGEPGPASSFNGRVARK